MKKYFAFLLMAAMLVVTGCNDRNLPVNGDGEEVLVTFTITAEQAAALQKKQAPADETIEYPNPSYPADERLHKISGGTRVNTLVFAVYNNSGVILSELGKGYIDKDEEEITEDNDKPNHQIGEGQSIMKVDEFPVQISLRLVRGQSYKLAFWAQYDKCHAYNTKDLTDIKIDYEDVCNNEYRDAFCKLQDITVRECEYNVVLKRPFAQINLGITKDDYEAAIKADFRVTKSSISLKNVASTFNLITGETGTATELTYELNKIPAYFNFGGTPTEDRLKEANYAGWEQFLEINLDEDPTIVPYGTQNNKDLDETYKYLMMCYVLPADNYNYNSTEISKTTLDEVEIKLFDPQSGREFVLNEALTNLPIQRNWRTNIFGSLLTSEIKIMVNLDPMYDGDHNWDMETWCQTCDDDANGD